MNEERIIVQEKKVMITFFFTSLNVFFLTFASVASFIIYILTLSDDIYFILLLRHSNQKLDLTRLILTSLVFVPMSASLRKQLIHKNYFFVN